MYYFDQKYLQQYIDQKVKLKVFSDGQWYRIADQTDLSDPVNGIGYDEYGQDHRFDYRDIDKIQVNSQILTLDWLQKQMTGEEPEKEKSKPKTEPNDTMPDDDKAKRDREVSHYDPYQVGRNLINEVRRLKN